ncbi:transporter [Blastopirellula marina]|nr:transporter [Blastopirellula marina]
MSRPSTFPRWKRVSLALALGCCLWGREVHADDTSHAAFRSCLSGTCFDPCDSAANIVRTYGPCACQRRGALMQWSYGTSFTGGPNLDEPLVTDRPDFTEASSTVGRGVAQIEMGYTYIHDNDGTTTTDSHSYPETLLRYGVWADWLEFRIAWNYGHQSSELDDIVGSEDLYLGFKIGLTPQEGILPETALIPQMVVPTGADEMTADRVLPGLNWLYGWDLCETISTAGSTQFNSAVDEETNDVYTEWAQSWTIGYSLTDKLGGYTEWYALFPHGAETMLPEHYLNGGFTYLISDNIQWDIRIGGGLNDAADDLFVGSGVSVRFY